MYYVFQLHCCVLVYVSDSLMSQCIRYEQHMHTYIAVTQTDETKAYTAAVICDVVQ